MKTEGLFARGELCPARTRARLTIFQRYGRLLPRQQCEPSRIVELMMQSGGRTFKLTSSQTEAVGRLDGLIADLYLLVAF